MEWNPAEYCSGFSSSGLQLKTRQETLLQIKEILQSPLEEGSFSARQFFMQILWYFKKQYLIFFSSILNMFILFSPKSTIISNSMFWYRLDILSIRGDGTNKLFEKSLSLQVSIVFGYLPTKSKGFSFLICKAEHLQHYI